MATKVEKLGDNRIKITKEKTIDDATGKKVKIYDEPIELGEVGVQQNIDNQQAMIDFLNDPDARSEAIAKHQAELDFWLDVQSQLNE